MKYVPGSNSGTKKSLGQHWLHDETILQAIVKAGDVQKGDSVLEIGPGLGTLTDVIAVTGATVTALEFDQDLIKGLNKKFANTSQVNIQEGDIRTYDFSLMPADYKVIANIPYYLTSHLIRSMSETSNQPAVAVLLIQKEVAERVAATPGSMGILSVTAQFYYECSLDVEVPAKYFTPPPKVDSQVLVLKRRDKKLFDVDEKQFFRFIKAGFSEKRKTMRNALSGGLNISKDQADELLKMANIATNVRAQELSMQQWSELFNCYDAQSSNSS